MRLVGWWLAPVLVLALALPSTSDAVGQRKSSRWCRPDPKRTLVSDKVARVYTRREQFGNLDVRACALGHRSVAVNALTVYGDNAGPCVRGCLEGGWQRLVKLAGPLVAYAANHEEDTKYGQCFCSSWSIVVRDLRTGRLVHKVSTGPHHGSSAFDYYLGVGPARGVVVDRNGSVAWIAEDFVAWSAANFPHDAQGNPLPEPRPQVPVSYELRVLDDQGERVLASGPNVDPASLTLRDNELRWTQGGTPFSSLLD